MRHHTHTPRDMYEFKVIPAPRKGERVPGLTTDEARMANTMTGLLNEMGSDGWDYVRTDTLPSEQRADVTGTSSGELVMLVFRRPQEISRSARRKSVSLAPLLLTEPRLQEGDVA